MVLYVTETAKAVRFMKLNAMASAKAVPAAVTAMIRRKMKMNKLLRILGKRGRITIPYEIRRRVGFAYNDVLSFTEAKDGRTVIVRREKICDDCVDHEVTEFTNTVKLEDFLDDLSADQQRQALVHLSLRWAEKQGGVSNG